MKGLMRNQVNAKFEGTGSNPCVLVWFIQAKKKRDLHVGKSDCDCFIGNSVNVIPCLQ